MNILLPLEGVDGANVPLASTVAAAALGASLPLITAVSQHSSYSDGTVKWIQHRIRSGAAPKNVVAIAETDSAAIAEGSTILLLNADSASAARRARMHTPTSQVPMIYP